MRRNTNSDHPATTATPSKVRLGSKQNRSSFKTERPPSSCLIRHCTYKRRMKSFMNVVFVTLCAALGVDGASSRFQVQVRSKNFWQSFIVDARVCAPRVVAPPPFRNKNLQLTVSRLLVVVVCVLFSCDYLSLSSNRSLARLPNPMDTITKVPCLVCSPTERRYSNNSITGNRPCAVMMSTMTYP